MSPAPYEPFDWGKDDERRRDRASDHWYRGPDNSPLLSGQFWAMWTAHMEDFRALQEKVEQNERRLVEERGREFLHDVWYTLWGKVIVIMFAIVSAYVLTNYGLHLP